MTRIKLLAVGATLTGQGADSLALARYVRDISGLPRLTPGELIRRVPEVNRFAVVEPDQDWGQFEQEPPAGELWREVAERLQLLLDDPGVGGAVLVHGTNVLEETAYFLHLVLKSEKPVVVVGAQRPITALSTDGPLNLVNAVRVAASPHAAARGVLVVLNDEIHSARHASKTSTYRLHAFQAPGLGPIGWADADGVVFYYRLERRHTVETPFSVGTLQAWPRVDILYGHHGADERLVEAAVHLGADGLVLAAAGAGWPGGMKDALRNAVRRGVAVVRSTRVGSGRVLGDDNSAFPGSIAAGDLNPQKARVLLQLGLMLTRDVERLQGFFDIY